jgi:hypothetical protein
MVESIGGLLMVAVVLFLLVATVAPVIISFRRKHRNRWIIAMLTGIAFFLPAVAGLVVWIIALAWSMYKEQEVSGIKGEKGDKGDQGYPGMRGPVGAPGRDGEDGIDGIDGQDAVPLSKAGVINRRNR